MYGKYNHIEMLTKLQTISILSNSYKIVIWCLNWYIQSAVDLWPKYGWKVSIWLLSNTYQLSLNTWLMVVSKMVNNPQLQGPMSYFTIVISPPPSSHLWLLFHPNNFCAFQAKVFWNLQYCTCQNVSFCYLQTDGSCQQRHTYTHTIYIVMGFLWNIHTRLKNQTATKYNDMTDPPWVYKLRGRKLWVRIL